MKTIPYNVVLTECPTYVEKAEYFFEQDAILYFIIGSDTWNRLIDPKYGYNSSELYTKLHELNARFVVLNREGHEKIENDLLDKLVYKDHKNRPDTFNVPISSSLIRSGEAENKLENL